MVPRDSDLLGREPGSARPGCATTAVPRFDLGRPQGFSGSLARSVVRPMTRASLAVAPSVLPLPRMAQAPRNANPALVVNRERRTHGLRMLCFLILGPGSDERTPVAIHVVLSLIYQVAYDVLGWSGRVCEDRASISRRRPISDSPPRVTGEWASASWQKGVRGTRSVPRSNCGRHPPLFRRHQ